MLIWLQQLVLIARLAWRNTWRHRRRTLITAGAMAVGSALCMATIALNDGVYGAMFDVLVVQQLGHVQVHAPGYRSTRSLHTSIQEGRATLAAIDAAPGTLAASGRVEGFVLLGTERKSVGALLLGVDPVRELAVNPLERKILEGTFLPAEPGGKIVLGVDLARSLGVRLGDTLVAVTQSADGSLGNTLFTVAGIIRTGTVQVDRGGAFVHVTDLQDLLVVPDRLHAITIVTEDERAIAAYAESLREQLPKTEVLTWWEASPQAAQLMGMRETSAVIVLGVVFGAAAFGVLNTMMMSVFERTREIGVLQAIGLRPGRIVALVVVESVMLAAVSGGLGLVLGGLLDAYLVFVGIDMSSASEDGFSFVGITIDPVMRGQVRLIGVVEVLAAVFVVSIAASILPAIRAARLEPVTAMRAE